MDELEFYKVRNGLLEQQNAALLSELAHAHVLLQKSLKGAEADGNGG